MYVFVSVFYLLLFLHLQKVLASQGPPFRSSTAAFTNNSL